MPSSKTEIIQAVYQAFGRGDVAAVVRAFAPDGEIRFNVARPAAPWQATVAGHAGIPSFFGALAECVEFSAFEPRALVEGENEVIARVHMRFKVKKTGRIVEQTQVHWWTFADTKIRSIEHFEDTAQVAAAVA